MAKLWWVLLVLLLTGCGSGQEARERELEATDPLLIVDGVKIPAWRYLAFLERELAESEETPDEAECEAAGARAVSDVLVYIAVENMAAEYGLALTEEDAAALTAGHWEDLPEEQRCELARTEMLYSKLCATEFPQEALLNFAAEKHYRTVDRLLIPAGEEAEKQAAELFSQLNGGDYEVFSAAKAQWGDSAAPYTFVSGSGVLPQELEEAALVLAPGQLSGLLETEEGLSVLYCLETDISEIRIPWLDENLLRRAAEMEVSAAEGYRTDNIYAKLSSVYGKSA